MKVVINDVKTGRSFQKDVPKENEGALYSKRIGQTVDGSAVGLAGYTLKIAGGSDSEGFPMRAEIGAIRANALLSRGPGVRGLKHGQKVKKTIAGHTVSEHTAQLNLKIEAYGEKPLTEFGLVAKEKTPEERKAARDAKLAAKQKKKGKK